LGHGGACRYCPSARVSALGRAAKAVFLLLIRTLVTVFLRAALRAAIIACRAGRAQLLIALLVLFFVEGLCTITSTVSALLFIII